VAYVASEKSLGGLLEEQVQGNMRLTSREIRRIILEQSKRANVGHIGSALSIAGLIVAFYEHVLHIPHPDHPDRDRFIFSRRHAVLAGYAALFLKGWLGDEDLNTYCGDATLLGVHPEHCAA
jgi:transketolase